MPKTKPNRAPTSAVFFLAAMRFFSVHLDIPTNHLHRLGGECGKNIRSCAHNRTAVHERRAGIPSGVVKNLGAKL